MKSRVAIFGFAVAIVEARSIDGETYGRTGNDLWVPMRDLTPTRPFPFQGAEVAEGAAAVPFAWVVTSSARVYAGPNRQRPTGESIAQFVRVDWLEEGGTFERFPLGGIVEHPGGVIGVIELDGNCGS